MQASQPKDGWKTLTGMRLAVTVQMTVMGNQLNVNIGEGQWSDKIGAGAIGLFVAWPLAITAGMGAFKQKKLPGEVFQVIETTVPVRSPWQSLPLCKQWHWRLPPSAYHRTASFFALR